MSVCLNPPLFSVNWQDEKTYLLLNPALPLETQRSWRKATEEINLKGHIWLATSGSSRLSLKLVALSKLALLASARAVNLFLDSRATDRWLNALPPFHVGALSIWARAFVSGAIVREDPAARGEKWNPSLFYENLQNARATLTSLTPTHLYDLVQSRLEAPASLRAVIIGGSSLSPFLYEKGLDLRWPLLPSYGCTECSSQIATASLPPTPAFPSLRLLPHIAAQLDEGSRLLLKSESLLTGYAFFEGDKAVFCDPKKQGWFTTEDCALLEGPFLAPLGRGEDFIKIGGEGVYLSRLETLLETIKIELRSQTDAALIPFPDKRLGHVLHLATTAKTRKEAQILVDLFHQRALPYERIRSIHFVSSIPRSPLFKVLKKELLASLY